MSDKPTKDQLIFDAIISAALDMLRVGASERAASAATLKELESKLIGLLTEFNTTDAKPASVAKFIEKTNKVIDATYKTLAQQVDLPGIAEVSADSMAEHLSTAIGEAAANAGVDLSGAATKNAIKTGAGTQAVAAALGKDTIQVLLGKDALEKPSADYLKSVASDVLIQGAPSADWWNGQSVDIQNKFAQQLRLGMGAGETNAQIVSRIVGSPTQSGVMDIARAQANALVTTSVQTVANDARRATFDANDDIIKGIRQVSTLDGHTSIICVSYSGAEWDMNRKPINGNTLNYGNGTPRHWRCRSVEVPITKTFRELGLDIDEPPSSTRASVDGQISDKTTFNDFLERKGKGYQNTVLGEGRADLWREGKITLRDLVDSNGNELTLEQLRAKVARR